MTNWRKKFARPTPESVWCDECLRWETGNTRFERPPETFGARIFWAVARLLHGVAYAIHGIGDRFQIRANIKNGVFDSRG